MKKKSQWFPAAADRIARLSQRVDRGLNHNLTVCIKKHPLYCDILGLYHKELVTYLTLWQTGYVAQWVDALSKTNIGSVSEWCRWKVEQKLKMAMSLLCDVIPSYLREVKTILHFNFFFFF